nr:hypothetical protein [Tanacetum cinerariifolium]
LAGIPRRQMSPGKLSSPVPLFLVVKVALGLLKAISGDLLLLYVAVEQIPTRYRKVLAGLSMTLAAAGIKLVLVAFNFMGLSGSEEGKKVAKAAQEITDELHEKARKLTEDSMTHEWKKCTNMHIQLNKRWGK